MLAWSAVVAGVAAPILRRPLRLPAPAVLGTAALAPFGLSVATRRTPARDVGVCVLQMWAYFAAYQMPNDDPEALERRVHVDYPVRIDRVLGLGVLPNIRLQRAFGAPGRIQWRDKLFIVLARNARRATNFFRIPADCVVEIGIQLEL